MRDIGAQFREYARLERKRADAGFTPEELLRWTRLKRALAKRFAPGLSDSQADLRTSLRVPARLNVSFHSQDELVESIMTNVSRGGVFIATPHLPEIGTKFRLRIQIEDSDEHLEVAVVVICHNVGPQSNVVQGMGVRFDELDSSVEKRIMDLYEKALHAAADEPENPPGRPGRR